MLPAQGLRQLDPYSTLQLHPSASRDLVVAAYWILVARYKRRLPSSSITAAAAQLAELNSAYSTLLDDEARRQYDADAGLADITPAGVEVHQHSTGLFGLGTTVTVVSNHADYYHLLQIDRTADDEIIDAAYSVLARRTTGYNLQDVFLHDLFDEAHRTLQNPQLRAQYDASLASNGNGHARPAPPATPMALAVADAPVETARPMLPPAPGHVAGAEPRVAESQPAPAPSEPAAASNGHGPVTGRPPLRKRLGLTRHDDNHRPAGLTSAVGARITSDRDVAEAEQARLLTLRDGESGSAAFAEPSPGEGESDTGLAALEFIGGPRADSRVTLGSRAITLGSSFNADVVLDGAGGRGSEVAPEHARIWLHGDHFILRQIGGSTTVAGQDLTLPLVMLDDGDEIVIGPHRIRFNQPA